MDGDIAREPIGGVHRERGNSRFNQKEKNYLPETQAQSANIDSVNGNFVRLVDGKMPHGPTRLDQLLYPVLARSSR